MCSQSELLCSVPKENVPGEATAQLRSSAVRAAERQGACLHTIKAAPSGSMGPPALFSSLPDRQKGGQACVRAPSCGQLEKHTFQGTPGGTWLAVFSAPPAGRPLQDAWRIAATLNGSALCVASGGRTDALLQPGLLSWRGHALHPQPRRRGTLWSFGAAEKHPLSLMPK